jgi:hypothetical protein
MNNESVFSEIYQNRRWGKNVPLSGEGSSPEAVNPYLELLRSFLDQHNDIRTILDVGHGDWEMWPAGFFQQYQYFGVDVVSTLSIEMSLIHGNSKTAFISGDFLEMDLPSSDVLLIKDVLIHLSNADIAKALQIFSAYRYVIITTDIHSSGIRVFLACLTRLLSRQDWRALLRAGFRPRKIIEHELDSDIETGGYHWVNMSSALWNSKLPNHRIIELSNYEVSGITLGRKVTKQIAILGL